MKRAQPASLARQMSPTPRFLALTLLACLLGMGISYFTVRYLTRNLSTETRVDAAEIQRAQLLRSCSNGLLKLVEDYLEQVPDKDKAAKPAARRWIEQVFRPGINQLRLRLAGDAVLLSPPGGGLLSATGLAATLRGRGGEAGRRRLAGEALRASAAVERYIASLEMGRYLGEPPYVAGFDENG